LYLIFTTKKTVPSLEILYCDNILTTKTQDENMNDTNRQTNIYWLYFITGCMCFQLTQNINNWVKLMVDRYLFYHFINYQIIFNHFYQFFFPISRLFILNIGKYVKYGLKVLKYKYNKICTCIEKKSWICKIYKMK